MNSKWRSWWYWYNPATAEGHLHEQQMETRPGVVRGRSALSTHPTLECEYYVFDGLRLVVQSRCRNTPYIHMKTGTPSQYSVYTIHYVFRLKISPTLPHLSTYLTVKASTKQILKNFPCRLMLIQNFHVWRGRMLSY